MAKVTTAENKCTKRPKWEWNFRANIVRLLLFSLFTSYSKQFPNNFTVSQYENPLFSHFFFSVFGAKWIFFRFDIQKASTIADTGVLTQRKVITCVTKKRQMNLNFTKSFLLDDALMIKVYQLNRNIYRRFFCLCRCDVDVWLSSISLVVERETERETGRKSGFRSISTIR